jgi:hypothetical protein
MEGEMRSRKDAASAPHRPSQRRRRYGKATRTVPIMAMGSRAVKSLSPKRK